MMIEPILGLPDNVLGFVAKGRVTADDYELVLIPAVEALFAKTSQVSILYHLGPDFSGFEAAAMWDDAKIGMKHIGGWNRIAVVSDIEWIRAGVKIFAHAIPAQVRVFHNSEFLDAKHWLAE